MLIELYNYQQEALDKMKNGCILCGGVGSGKSRTSLAYYFVKECGGLIDGTIRGYENDYAPMTHPKDLYIITTARKRDTHEWEGELLTFGMSIENPSYKTKVVIDSWNNIKKYVEVKNAFFIFDEQRVVGSGSWTKSFIKITKSNHWILLSATPGDTWTDYIPVFVANGFYKNRSEFLRRHAVYSYYTKYPQITRFIEQGRLIKLRNEILITMDYTRPTVTHDTDILVDYNRYNYDRIHKDRWDIYANEPIENISKLCYLMRKVVNSDMSRSEAIEALVIEHPKVIIFYNFDYELEILKSLEYPSGTKIAEWNGHEHQPIPKADKWVYLVQYSAGAEGWNCTLTDTIIFYSQTYSYKTLVQSKGRIDRLNTPFKELYYFHLKSNAPIDIGIRSALKRKRNFNESKFLNK